MSKAPQVQLLNSEIVGRIAAGEVVDRPASVLKELLDNAIDAGSTQIKILLIEAGMKRIEVIDDGAGMGPEDLKLCTLRHATSKISSLEDLDHIHSLGFRGEALAATASVAKLRIESFQKGASEAWAWEAFGSTKGELTPVSLSKGTKVKIEDIFFNVPARKKFLKSLSSEYQECLTVLQNMALAHPRLAFSWNFLNESGELKESFECSPETLGERFRNLFPHDGELLHVQAAKIDEGVENVNMAFYKSPVSSRFKKDIHLIVNGRPVEDARLPYALREAYSGLIESSRYPVGVIDMKVDPSIIDVNIHPQKKEVRWPKGFSVASVAYSLLRPHLEVAPSAPQVSDQDPGLRSSFSAPSASTLFASTARAPAPHSQNTAVNSSGERFPVDNFRESMKPFVAKPSPGVALSVPAGRKEDIPNFKFSELKIVGEVGAAWIVCEAPSGMIVLDQHAAHERINFEKILLSKDLLRSKALLIPVEYTLPPFAHDDALQLVSVFEKLGFELSDESLKSLKEKSGDTVEFIAVPEADRKIDWEDLLGQLFSEIREDGNPEHWEAKIKYRIAASLACHGSIRRGQRIGHDQIKALLEDMDKIQWGGLCPHGRPVWLSFTHDWIETAFHR
ncbi:DNA mismatch repair endonuclease MutL [bacterium]|nr:DNA mismatch repair endonuclease MutL [bacterium]